MHIYNWYHSNVTGIHYVHEYRLQYTWCNSLAFYLPLLVCFPLLHSFLLPIGFPLLTWNPPCCDRIRPPRSQVARKLIFPFPSPCSYACAVHSERGLGCALIKSTLGSGKPGKGWEFGGGERTREQWGTKGISLRAAWD